MKSFSPSTARSVAFFLSALSLSMIALESTALAQTATSDATSLGGRPLIVPSQTASLADFLISKLRATTEEQRAYVREVAKLVDEKKLERRLVLALQRYAVRKSPYFPLPVFERALRVEAGKRHVPVPMIQEIVQRNGANTARSIRESRFR
jgi:hypothetical protein